MTVVDVAQLTSKSISEETINEVRKLNIKEFAEALGDKLQRSGKNFMAYRNGGENTPSVAITPSKHLWKDFTRDGAYGNDALSYFAYREWNETDLRGEKFKIAVHQVCAIAGIPVKYSDGSILNPDAARRVSAASPIEDTSEDDKRDPATLDRFYRCLLSLMNLSEVHRQHLMEERCMTISEIESRSYRTATANLQTRYKLTKQLINQLQEEPEGIPGFVQIKGEYGPYWSLAAKNGYFVPFRNVLNQIVGLQLRADDPDFIFTPSQLKATVSGEMVEVTETENGQVRWKGPKSKLPVTLKEGKVDIRKGNKYLWFSTHKDEARNILKGARISQPTPAPFHVAVPSRVLRFWEVGEELSNYMDTSTVWLGEGPIKGDIAAEYTDNVHLQAASVSAMESLFQPAVALGAQEIIIAPDADAQTKTDSVGETVLRLIDKAVEYFIPMGIQVKFAAWNAKQAKGLDDLLNQQYKPHILQWSAEEKGFVHEH